ncbi:MAG: SMC-Scp complex subunit ScpB, partial [Chlamydia sp. 32-24]
MKSQEITLFEIETAKVPQGTKDFEYEENDDCQTLLEDTIKEIKNIIEALLFASNDPISFQKFRDIIESEFAIKPKQLKQIINDLKNDYETSSKAIRLEEIANGFLLRTSHHYNKYIEMLFKNRKAERLSQPATEVLAIIAFKQPITRPQIDAIRGVDSSGVIHNLLERQLIEGVGKLEAPGKPTL